MLTHYGDGLLSSSFCLILNSSVSVWVGTHSAGDLVSNTSQLRILHSAEKDNLSPFDSTIVLSLCMSVCMCVWDLGFESCIQQRKTICLLPIRISHMYVCMYVLCMYYVCIMYVSCMYVCICMYVCMMELINDGMVELITDGMVELINDGIGGIDNWWNGGINKWWN